MGKCVVCGKECKGLVCCEECDEFLDTYSKRFNFNFREAYKRDN